MNKAGFIYITIGVIAIVLIVYGSFLLLSPGYREKLKTRPMKYKKQPPHVAKLGSFWLEPGVGMNMEESGQKFSHYAPGQNPNLAGRHSQEIVEEESNPEGDQKFFDMFID